MDHITMNKKEREQLIVFEKVKAGMITRVEASFQLGISERWARQKYKRYIEFGTKGLVHRNRGKPSTRRWDPKERSLAIDLLKSEWEGFGPTFAAEKLREIKGIKVSKETIRQEMIKEGIRKVKNRRKNARKQRERRPMKGLLVQLDGSPHDWFEGRAPECTLLVFIDDATSDLLWLEFVKSESCLDVMRATKNYISLHGRPHEFYVDHGSVFSVNLNNPERDKITQWERAVKELSIRISHAHSPQAKGRVERANKTMQDRLIKEMRLAEISSIEEANAFVQSGNFITRHNQRFGVIPAKIGNAHRPANLYNLDEIFCIKEERILTNDHTISFRKRLFQLDTQQRTIIRPKDLITIRTYLDKSIKLFIRNTELMFKEIYARPRRKIVEKTVKQPQPRKPCENSRRWASGLTMFAKATQQESRVKPAPPAVEAKKKKRKFSPCYKPEVFTLL